MGEGLFRKIVYLPAPLADRLRAQVEYGRQSRYLVDALRLRFALEDMLSARDMSARQLIARVAKAMDEDPIPFTDWD